MKVNDYLPSRIRVLSTLDRSKAEHDIVTRPLDAVLPLTQADCVHIHHLKDANQQDELFRFLFLKQCNQLHDILPNLFEPTADYTELLLPISFTDRDGIVYHLVHDISEADFDVVQGGQVEISGWLYQYSNAELKEQFYNDLKKNIKIAGDRLPATTQLFTPEWIVKYMVENTLGRFWLENHPDTEFLSHWHYYLAEPEQTPEVCLTLTKLRESIYDLDPKKFVSLIQVWAVDIYLFMTLMC
ncbi:MAG TPA: hypothetical protein GX717_03815 [Clostridiaceae bacterium]|nr:hypothetical protein [Clostridiaceae bacterium]